MNTDHALHLIPRDTTEIRLAIVGMGKMGTYHLRSLEQLAAGRFEDYYKGDIQRQLNKIRVTGLCDTDPDKTAPFDHIPHYTDFTAMLDKARPDIVIIASPTQTHYNFAKTALHAGCHAFVEKPIVTVKNHIHELVGLAEQKGLRLMSGHVERYNPVSITIRTLLLEKQLTPESYSFVRMQRHDERIADDIIVDKVIHDLDLALYFFGDIETSELSQTRIVDGKIFQAAVSLHHRSGVTGRLFVSWLVDSDDKTRQVSIRGNRGREIFGDFFRKKLLLDGREVECHVPGWIKPDSNQIKDELVDFLFYCTQPAPEANHLKPLLSIPEIVHSTEQLSSLLQNLTNQ